MDMSELRSDAYIKKEIDTQNMHRTIMKYRLYGRDGVTPHELKKLTHEWNIIPKDELSYLYSSIKKRVKKKRFNPQTQKEEEYSTDMSGEESECYQFKYDPFLYNDKSNVDMSKVNKGFALRPLDPEIYGIKKAMESKIKFITKKAIVGAAKSSRNKTYN